MYNVYIVSLFEGFEGKLNKFHFIGFYHGIKIKKILVSGGEFKKDQAYLVALSPLKVKGETLYGNYIKSKKLFS